MKKSNLPLWLLGGTTAGLIIWGGSKISSADLKNAVNIVTGGALDAGAFFLKYYPYAQQSEAQTNVPALVTLAQAATESGYGKYAFGNNFFGIKAGSAWTGATQKLKTWECGKTGDPSTDNISDEVIQIFPPGDPNGNASCNSNGSYSYRVYSIFRAYATPLDSFIDHGNFLVQNKRYAPAFNTTTPADFALAVAAAGYSTAPTYGKMLVNTMLQAQNDLA
jgi:flagellum-specific peptidoglycan hydrolase FlgJ